MQPWVLLIRRYIGVRVEEIRSRVEPIGAAMDVELPVNVIRSRSRAHVDVGAARRALLGVIHRSVYANFLDCFRRRRRNRFADRQVNRSTALDRQSAQCGRRSHTCFIHNARRRYLARRLPIEEVFRVNAVQKKRIARVALAIGPNRLIAQPCIRARARGKFLVDARSKQHQTRE